MSHAFDKSRARPGWRVLAFRPVLPLILGIFVAAAPALSQASTAPGKSPSIQVLAVLQGGRVAPRAAAWHPDGRSFALADGHRVHRFDAEGRALGIIEDPDASVGFLLWSPDGKVLYTAPSHEGPARLLTAWNPNSGEMLWSWPPGAQSAATAKPGSAGLPVAPGVAMNLEEKKLVGWMPASCIALSPDGRQLAYAVGSSGPIIVLDLGPKPGGTPIVSSIFRTSDDPLEPQLGHSTHCMTFSADGSKLVVIEMEYRDSGPHFQVVLDDLASGGRRAFEIRYGEDPLLCLPSPDLGRVAVWKENGALELYDLAAALAEPPGAKVPALRLVREKADAAPPWAWSADSRLLLAEDGLLDINGVAQRGDGSASWVPLAHANGYVRYGLEPRIRERAILPDARAERIIALAEDGARVLTRAGGASPGPSSPITLGAETMRIALNASGTAAFAAAGPPPGADGRGAPGLFVRDLPARPGPSRDLPGEPRLVYRDERGFPVVGVASLPDDSAVLVDSDGLRLVDPRTGAVIRRLDRYDGQYFQIHRFVPMPGGTTFVASGEGGRVFVLDAAKEGIRAMGPSFGYFHFANFSPRGGLFALRTDNYDWAYLVTNRAPWTQSVDFRLIRPGQNAEFVPLDEAGTEFLVLDGDEHSVYVWNRTQRKVVKSLAAESQEFQPIGWNPAGTIFYWAEWRFGSGLFIRALDGSGRRELFAHAIPTLPGTLRIGANGTTICVDSGLRLSEGGHRAGEGAATILRLAKGSLWDPSSW